MDIVELSKKMEADLLESRTSSSSYKKFIPNHGFSPRLTRSQTSNGKKASIIVEDVINPQAKRNQKKVDEVEKIYLNKKTKVVHKNLETIYEDPLWKKGNTILVGTSKVKRSIYLDREFRITSKQKSKMRKMKIKRLGKKRIKPLKMSDDEFKRKMMRIENFIDGSDIDTECRNEDCDVEFDDNDNNEDCNDFEIGNVVLNGEEECTRSDRLYNEFVI